MTKVLGINNEVTTCDCCGRSNLKKTVVIGDECGERRYGVVCAARFLGRKPADIRGAAVGAEVLRLRPISHWILRNEDRGVWVGGLVPVQFATREAAESRAGRNGFRGTAQPCYV